MIYFDTAYLAKCYLNEHGSEEVRALATSADRVACCAFGRLELAATIHRNLREGKITARQGRIIHAQIDLDEANRLWTWLPVTEETLDAAVVRLRSLRPGVHLRSADALHLTCAAEHGFKEVFSNDRHLLEAARDFGIKGRDVITPRAG